MHRPSVEEGGNLMLQSTGFEPPRSDQPPHDPSHTGLHCHLFQSGARLGGKAQLLGGGEGQTKAAFVPLHPVSMAPTLQQVAQAQMEMLKVQKLQQAGRTRLALVLGEAGYPQAPLPGAERVGACVQSLL